MTTNYEMTKIGGEDADYFPPAENSVSEVRKYAQDINLLRLTSNRFRALRDGMLRQFTRKNEAN